MTATLLTQHQARAHALAEKLIEFLETSEVPDGLFTADVFCDFTMPTWRLQARGVEDSVARAARRPPRAGDGAAAAVRSDADRVRPRSRGGLGLGRRALDLSRAVPRRHRRRGHHRALGLLHR
jgi:hypothetical protein